MHSFLDEMNFWIIPLKPMVLQISAFCTDKFYYKYLTQAPLIGTKYKSISSVHKKNIPFQVSNANLLFVTQHTLIIGTWPPNMSTTPI